MLGCAVAVVARYIAVVVDGGWESLVTQDGEHGEAAVGVAGKTVVVDPVSRHLSAVVDGVEAPAAVGAGQIESGVDAGRAAQKAMVQSAGAAGDVKPRDVAVVVDGLRTDPGCEHVDSGENAGAPRMK